MSEFRARYGPWALVAGASEGIGEAFAEALADRGLDLVLIARRADLLEKTAQRIAREKGVRTRSVPLDLGTGHLPQQLRRLNAEHDIGLAVYNAAFSPIGEFLQRSLEDKLRAVDINCRGPLVVADVLGRSMAERGRGGLVLVSSMVALQGAPRLATYAATKAFERVLAEGLWGELGPQGVDVTTCIAGATRTPGYEHAVQRSSVHPMSPHVVAEEALAALGRKPTVVAGLRNRIPAFVMQRLLPRPLAVQLIERATRELDPG